MGPKNRGRTLVVGLVVGVLMGAGFAMVTPAGATVKSAAAAINWKNIWKTEIKPRAELSWRRTGFVDPQMDQVHSRPFRQAS